MEKTFVLLKPDAVQRQLIGEIISRFERTGLKIIAMNFVQITEEFAGKHYAVHKERPFFNDLINYITSGPVVAMVIEGVRAIEVVRKLVGITNPVEAAPGTIRGDFALQIGRNLVHASDSPDTAQTEIELWFDKDILVSYDRALEKWIFE